MAITLDTIQSDFHSISIKDGSGNVLTLNASGNVGIYDAGNSITVDAVALDIRALTNADVVTAEQGTSPWVIGDGGGAITVDAVALDIRALTNADVVTAEQGTSPWVVSGSVATTPAGFATWKVSKVSATTTAAQLAATSLVGRDKIIIQNLGNQDVFLKDANTVSVNDLKLPKGSSLEIEFDAAATMWAITASGTADLRIAEFAA
jgi:hypothetical protein